LFHFNFSTGVKRKISAMKSSNSKKRAIPTGSDQSFCYENSFFIRQMYASYIERKFMVIFSHKHTNHMYCN